MPSLTPLTQRTPMRPLTPPIINRHLHLNPTPLLNPIRHTFRIRLFIHLHLTQPVASPAALVVDAGVIASTPRVHPDRDGDFLARPGVSAACFVVADEAGHDVCVVGFCAGAVGVLGVEVEGEVFFFEEEEGDGWVEVGVHAVWWRGVWSLLLLVVIVVAVVAVVIRRHGGIIVSSGWKD